MRIIKSTVELKISDIELVKVQTFKDLKSIGFKPRNDLPYFKLQTECYWKSNPFNDKNWTFQLHSWRHLDPLLFEFNRTKSHEVLIDILGVMRSWYEFSLTNKHQFLWYDMATGLRAQKISYIAYYAFSNDDVDTGEWFVRMINGHVDMLVAENQFSLNNHGIFQAHGLMSLSKSCQFENNYSQYLSDLASVRMAQLWRNQFYPEGIHTENSPEYHLFAYKKFIKISKSAWYGSISIDDELETVSNNVYWLCRPNGEIYPIGDSGTSRPKLNELTIAKEKMFSSEYKGIHYKMFLESGYFSAKSESTGMFLVTAKRNPVHSHNDALTFEWFDFNVPIVVDSGKYGYLSGPERKYVLSDLAHNCFLINGKKIVQGFYKTCINLIEKKAQGILVRARIEGEHGIHERTIYFAERKFMLVIDYFDLDECSEFRQKLQFDYRFKVKSPTNIIHSDNGLSLSIDSLTSSGISTSEFSSSLLSGTDNNEMCGYVSDAYGSLIEAPALISKGNAKVGFVATILSNSDDPFEIILESNRVVIVNINNEISDHVCIKEI